MVQRALGVIGLATIAFVLPVVACSSDKKDDGGVELPGREGKDSGTDAAPDCTKRQAKVSDVAACDTCAKANCCTEIVACDNSADCAALQKCLDGCSDTDTVCVLGCQAIHDKGGGILQEVGSCAQNKCAKECPSALSDAGFDAPF